MRVMILVKASKHTEAGVMPPTELFAQMAAYNEELVKAGMLLAGEGLHPSTQGARVLFTNGKKVVDGPFAEAKELIAGFWIWKVDSIAHAVEWIKRMPQPVGMEQDIEIRRVFEAEDFGEALTPELREKEEQLRAESEKRLK